MRMENEASAAEEAMAASEPATVMEPERRGQVERAEALRRLDEEWGSLPQDSLDRARQRLGMNDGVSSR